MPESRIDELNPEQLRAATAAEAQFLPLRGPARANQNSCGADGLARVAGDRSGPDHASYVHAQGFGRDVARARRALGETGSRTLGTVWGGTFHSVANRLLRTYGEAIGRLLATFRPCVWFVIQYFLYPSNASRLFVRGTSFSALVA